MSALTDFIRPVRSLLNDNDPDGIYAYENEQIVDALQSVVEFGKVPGFVIADSAIVPDLVAADDPNNYYRLCLRTAEMFVRERTRVSFNTRAFSEVIGQPFELVDAIIQEIYKLDNGEQCL